MMMSFHGSERRPWQEEPFSNSSHDLDGGTKGKMTRQKQTRVSNTDVVFRSRTAAHVVNPLRQQVLHLVPEEGVTLQTLIKKAVYEVTGLSEKIARRNIRALLRKGKLMTREGFEREQVLHPGEAKGVVLRPRRRLLREVDAYAATLEHDPVRELWRIVLYEHPKRTDGVIRSELRWFEGQTIKHVANRVPEKTLARVKAIRYASGVDVDLNPRISLAANFLSLYSSIPKERKHIQESDECLRQPEQLQMRR